MRTDLLTLRQIVAARQPQAADELIGPALHQTLIVSRFVVSRFMEDAGGNYPAHLPPRLEPGTYEYHEDADQGRMQIRNDG